MLLNEGRMEAAVKAPVPEPRLTFEAVLRRHGLRPLRRRSVRTVQVNVGKLCNQAGHHCHVDAGPKRREIMTAAAPIATDRHCFGCTAGAGSSCGGETARGAA
jgi:hypothetical protein